MVKGRTKLIISIDIQNPIVQIPLIMISSTGVCGTNAQLPLLEKYPNMYDTRNIAKSKITIIDTIIFFIIAPFI